MSYAYRKPNSVKGVVSFYGPTEFRPNVVQGFIDDQDTLLFQLPIDHVSGYNLKQLESALLGANGMATWKQNIKGQTQNPTEPFLDELFGFYGF